MDSDVLKNADKQEIFLAKGDGEDKTKNYFTERDLSYGPPFSPSRYAESVF